MRQVELAHRDLDLHPGIGVVAEYLGDAADRLRVLARLRDEIDGDHLARLGAAHFRGRHEDVVGDAPVLGNQERDAVLGVQPADDAALAALEHLDDHPGRTAALIAPGDAHGGAVAVQHFAHLRGRQENLRAAVVGHEKAMAVAMAFDASGDDRDALRDEQRACAVLHDVARALERRERLFEGIFLRTGDAQPLRELFRRERLARELERVQDVARRIVAPAGSDLEFGPLSH